MIEKIRITEQGLYNEHGTFLGTMPKDTDSLTLANKINELVDAVNELTNCVGQLGVEFTDTTPAENVQKIDIGELAYLQKENSDLKDEVEKLQKQVAEWQNANISLIKDSAICNTYTHIRWDELCRLREIADKYAEITGHKGVQND